MATEVILPRVDAGMTEGTILEWKKKEGDKVEQGEILFTIETQKVTFEVEAPASGILSKVFAQAGDLVTVGTVVSFILQPNEKMPEILVEKKKDMKNDGALAIQSKSSEKEITANKFFGIRASPLAKRIALINNIDLSLIKGSGPGGRIVKNDVLQFIEDAKKVQPDQEKIVPLSSMRRTIAQRLTQSFQSVPHFYLSVEASVHELSRVRDELSPSIEKLTGLRLTYTDLFLKIVAKALEECPEINVSWTEDGIRKKSDANLGLAVAVKDGLVVPVIRQANHKSLAEITKIRDDFTKRAREGRIMLDEMREGSITLTNLGMFGIEQFNAIINPPESCILAIGTITDKPVAENGQIVVRPRMNLNLAIDHRVLDGVSGSRFLRRIKELIEKPILMIAR